jgi:hypothetical protein
MSQNNYENLYPAARNIFEAGIYVATINRIIESARKERRTYRIEEVRYMTRHALTYTAWASKLN